MEEEFRGMYGESSEEVIERERQRDVGENNGASESQEGGEVPSDKEVEEHNLDHTVFGS